MRLWVNALTVSLQLHTEGEMNRFFQVVFAASVFSMWLSIMAGIWYMAGLDLHNTEQYFKFLFMAGGVTSILSLWLIK